MTDHDPVGNEQRAVDGDLTVASTARVSVRRRQRAVGVRASPRSPPTGGPSPSGWGSPPGWTHPASPSTGRTASAPSARVSSMRSSVHRPSRHGPAAQRERGGMRPAVGRRGPQPLGDAPLGKGQRSGDIQQSRARPAGQAQMNSLMPDRVASTRATRHKEPRPGDSVEADRRHARSSDAQLLRRGSRAGVDNGRTGTAAVEGRRRDLADARLIPIDLRILKASTPLCQ